MNPSSVWPDGKYLEMICKEICALTMGNCLLHPLTEWDDNIFSAKTYILTYFVDI